MDGMTNRELDKRMKDLRHGLGGTRAPSQVTQEAFDGDARHLHQLTHLSRDQAAAPLDLSKYADDLLYTEIDAPLFVHLLPTCLRAWHDDLRDPRSDYGAFVEHFYPVLADRDVFETHLTPRQTAAVSQFMRSSILDEMDAQRGLAFRGKNARPYRWIGALTTYGVMLPDIECLWAEWWTLETIGRAISLLQYVAALVYEDDKNPVFAPWSPTEGGGPPCLWEFAGHL